MSDKYILADDGKTPIKCDLMTWARAFERSSSRRLKRETVAEGVDVSTVFLGLDHSWGDGPPLLWETMIFGGPHDGYQERYSTHDEAMAGHAKAVALATGNQDCECEASKGDRSTVVMLLPARTDTKAFHAHIYDATTWHVVAFPVHVRRPDMAQWELSLRRLARAQALLWHETPINERLKILDRVDREKGES